MEKDEDRDDPVPVTMENDFHDAERQQTGTHKTQPKKNIYETKKKMRNTHCQNHMEKRKLATQMNE